MAICERAPVIGRGHTGIGWFRPKGGIHSMRPIYGIALTLCLAAPLSAPVSAAEPEAPETLIARDEAIRIAVQTRLSETFSATSEQKKDEKGALVEYYSCLLYTSPSPRDRTRS